MNKFTTRLSSPGKLLSIGALLAVGAFPGMGGSSQSIKGNTPRFVESATVLNHEAPTTVIEVSVWLNPHNRAQLDTVARDLYDPKSPNFRHWLKPADIDKLFAPTAAELATITKFFSAHNLTVTHVGPHNFFVRGQGTVSDVENAFHVQINSYLVRGKTIRANASDPFIDESEVAALVGHVSGLDSSEYVHPLALPLSTSSKGQVTSLGVTSDATPGFFVSDCFTGTKTEKYNTGGSYPKATYTGNNFYSSDTGPGCGYTPAEFRTAYNLNPLYKAGLDGTGQTIAIIDWCGSNTIRGDANAFSARFGLPKLTAENFTIIETPTPSKCAGPDVEINLDVEWAHAVAPGASIALIVPPSASFQDVNQAVFYAVNYDIGSVISGSYGSEELYTSPSELETENLINAIAVVSGIAANFSSGDSGDFTFGVYPASVSAPADSPYATAVGGVTLALNSDNSIKWQTGWGNNATFLQSGGVIQDPPLQYGFQGGAGGGPSAFFAQPFYQAGLPGAYRQLPDISWLADPYTGAVVAITEPNQFPPLTYIPVGGTSLAAPTFSALWAIANQAAGASGPLGQAAPYLYVMPAGAITDILPKTSVSNVKGTVYETSTTSTNYDAASIVGVPEGSPFYSAFWDYPFESYTTIVLSFGTDSGLTVTRGWDNVTGLGTPNGKAFVDAFLPATPAVK
jgi:subtilase family serine protease